MALIKKYQSHCFSVERHYFDVVGNDNDNACDFNPFFLGFSSHVSVSTDGENQQTQRGTSRDSDKVTPPPSGDSDPYAWHSTKKMIFVKPSSKNNLPSGFWPIPESFWPDPGLSKLVWELGIT